MPELLPVLIKLFASCGSKLPVCSAPNPVVADPQRASGKQTFNVCSFQAGFLPTQTLSGAAYAPDLDFVKVAVGSTFELGPHWYGTVTAFGLKGQGNVAAGGGNVGLAYRF